MACPEGARYSAEMFQTAMETLDLWQVFACPFGTPLGMTVVGTIVYGGFGLNIFIRTGSVIIPTILVLLLGGTIIAQMVGVITSFATILVLVVMPLTVSAMIFLLDQRA